MILILILILIVVIARVLGLSKFSRANEEISDSSISANRGGFVPGGFLNFQVRRSRDHVRSGWSIATRFLLNSRLHGN
ncbi:hypothetical protein BDV34DRAFT_194836 [Aspergillus parasiticus]|uniref:Secreted protein n=1 Tax=Aspergillus parasiticus TaxID=5067 RepID=A0A5N6DL63_ASPPA|nr:hypothetical protein BDV34DRAFT_194836 [Aspergillus parasiticus]